MKSSSKGLHGGHPPGYIEALYGPLVVEVKRDLEAGRAKAIGKLRRYVLPTYAEGSFGLPTDGLKMKG